MEKATGLADRREDLVGDPALELFGAGFAGIHDQVVESSLVDDQGASTTNISINDVGTKSLSVNKTCLSVGDNSCSHMQQCQIGVLKLFIADQYLSEAIEP